MARSYTSRPMPFEPCEAGQDTGKNRVLRSMRPSAAAHSARIARMEESSIADSHTDPQPSSAITFRQACTSGADRRAGHSAAVRLRYDGGDVACGAPVARASRLHSASSWSPIRSTA